MTILNKDAMVISSAVADAFGAVAPTTEAGLVKEAGQTGIFVYSTVDYVLYLKDAGGNWVSHANITASGNENITYPWGDYTAAFFVCADADANIHVFRKTGSILYDSTPETGDDSDDSLLQAAGDVATLQTAYSFPTADGTAGQVLETDGAGQLSWADAAAGGAAAASSFTFDASLIPDTNSVYDLGSAEKKIRHLYLSNNSIKFEGGDLNVVEGKLAWNGESLAADSGPEVLMVKMTADWNFVTTESNQKLTIPFDSVQQDSFAAPVFDIGTNKFTAVENGFYYINCSVYQTGINANETTQYQLRIESTNPSADGGGVAFRNYFPAGAPENTTYTHRLDRIVYLNAGDEVWVSLTNVGSPESDSSVSGTYSLTNLSFYKLK